MMNIHMPASPGRCGLAEPGSSTEADTRDATTYAGAGAASPTAACRMTAPRTMKNMATYQVKNTRNGIHQTNSPSHANGPVLKNVSSPPGMKSTPTQKL